MKQYTKEMVRDDIISAIRMMPVSKPKEVYGNMDEWTTWFNWDQVKSALQEIPQEKHFEFISSLFVMTVFHQGVFTHFYGLDKHFDKISGEYTKYRSMFQFPEFGGRGMAGTSHYDAFDLWTYALQDGFITVEELNSSGDDLFGLLKTWTEYFISECDLRFSYGSLIEKLRKDYSFHVRLKVRNQHRKDFPSEYISAMENAIREMLGCSEEERQEDLKKIETTRSIKRLLSRHRKAMDYLKDK